MSMSSHAVGIRPPNEKWKKMKAIWDACVAAGLEIPEEVENFFDGEPPDAKGVIVDLDEHSGVEPYSADMRSGFEIHLDKLPKDVKIIRFYNSC